MKELDNLQYRRMKKILMVDNEHNEQVRVCVCVWRLALSRPEVACVAPAEVRTFVNVTHW